nr:restriction endonuclease subunit S [Rheinheimera maricola]
MVKLGDLFKVTSGGTPSRSVPEYYENGDIPWIKTGDLHHRYIEHASEYITSAGLNASSTRLYPSGTVLVAMYGATIGACSILRITACTNQACAAFTPVEKVDTDYLYYFLKHSKPVFVNAGAGGAQPNISAGFLKNFEIPLPPLAEQKRIAAILDKADAIRRKRQQAIQLADDFLRAVFLEMFGDPVTNPKGWEVKKLGDIVRIRRGASPRPIKEFLGGTIPWIKIGDGSKGDQIYLHDTKEYVTKAGAEKSLYLNEGALIFANCGVSLGFARILKKAGCVHDGWLAFDEINPSFNKIFLLKWLNQLTSHFRKIAPDGTQPNLNTGIMKQQELICPPVELQERFENIVHLTDSMLNKLKTAELADEQQFSAISQKAFSGLL